MAKHSFLPESMYTLDSEMTVEKLSICHRNGTSVTGKIIRLYPYKEIFEVYLGGEIIVPMHIEDSTIYSLYKRESCRLSAYTYNLIGKTIRVKVVNIVGNNIFISRKANMEEAFLYFKNNKGIVTNAQITSFSNLSAYVDLGCGIRGKIPPKLYSPTCFHNIVDVGIKKEEIIPVEILDFDGEISMFKLGRIFPNPNYFYNVNDIVECQVFDKTANDPTQMGYYVLINTNTKGILDSPIIKLHYGDKVVARIKEVKAQGLKLNIIGYVEEP